MDYEFLRSSLGMLYFSAVIGGIGAGAVYGTCVGNALKWFPDKRGLAAGLTAAGFGAGAALTVIPIANMVKAGGYDKAFFTFGMIQGIVVLVLSLFLIRPPLTAIVATLKGAVNPMARRNIGPAEMLKTPVFWMLYLCMVLVASGGLMAAAEIGPIAKDYGVGQAASHRSLGHPAASDDGAVDRFARERLDPAFDRLDFGPSRPREHHGVGVYC